MWNIFRECQLPQCCWTHTLSHIKWKKWKLKGNKSSPLKCHPFSLNSHRGWGLVGGGGEEQQVTILQIWFCDCWTPHAGKKKITSTNRENTVELSAWFTRLSDVRNAAKDNCKWCSQTAPWCSKHVFHITNTISLDITKKLYVQYPTWLWVYI